MDEKKLIQVMSATETIPHDKTRRKVRTIYTTQMGDLRMDYATYGGSADEVPMPLVRRLESEGKLVRAFPDSPNLNAWILAPLATQD